MTRSGVATVLLRLPDDLRPELKAPMGPVTAEATELLEAVGCPLLSVGDVVTFSLEAAGRTPDVSVIDHLTERTAVPDAVEAALGGADHTVENPAATVTAGLVRAIRAALDADGPRRILVEGEEDLAVIPAVLLAPDGASVVYGQPGEGMVHVRVDPSMRERVEGLVDRMTGDPEQFRALVAG